jgi:acetyltransferase-like isoleucine patch superfamily enzyme
MRLAWLGGGIGWLARRAAEWVAPPHLDRLILATGHKRGYVSTRAKLYHPHVMLGEHNFVADDVIFFHAPDGREIDIDSKVAIYKGCVLETGMGASIKVGSLSSLHANVQVKAYVSDIEIGEGVMIAANCAMYSYNHSSSPDGQIRLMPLETKGPIVLGDGAWIGEGSILLSGVTIGKGAVVGAGAVVVNDVPDFCIAVGNPARVVKSRFDVKQSEIESLVLGK